MKSVEPGVKTVDPSSIERGSDIPQQTKESPSGSPSGKGEMAGAVAQAIEILGKQNSVFVLVSVGSSLVFVSSLPDSACSDFCSPFWIIFSLAIWHFLLAWLLGMPVVEKVERKLSRLKKQVFSKISVKALLKNFSAIFVVALASIFLARGAAKILLFVNSLQIISLRPYTSNDYL